MLGFLVAARLWEQMAPGRTERKAGAGACHEILVDYAWDIMTCWGCKSRTLKVSRCAINARPLILKFWVPPQPSGVKSFNLKKCYMLSVDVWMLDIDGPQTSTSNQLLCPTSRSGGAMKRWSLMGYIQPTHTESDGISPTQASRVQPSLSNISQLAHAPFQFEY